MSIVNLIVWILNLIAILAMIFIERKKPQVIIAWLAVMALFPIGGFILYVLIGGGLSIKTKRLLRKKRFTASDYSDFENEFYNKYRFNKTEIQEVEKVKNLINFNQNSCGSRLLVKNDIKIYTNGIDKLKDLKRDIRKAKHSINLEYYIFENDETGKEIMDLLIQKAKEGVKIKLIFDSVGCIRTKRKFFKQLTKVGGEVLEFFPPFMHIRLINLKMNYRDHRKIAVIDGKIGYTGGININDNHMGKNPKLSPWRDTHIRVEGTGVYALQNAFIDHWLFCHKKTIDPHKFYEEGYFPEMAEMGNTSMQIITSGPENNDQNIKNAMVQMILLAKKRIVIQTPYFVPDDIYLEALKIAHKSGVEVILMIPKIPDKHVVYWATLSYAKDLVDMGIKVYRHNSFLHAKTLTVDDTAVTIGSCNADNRSFGLNFEINSVLYGHEITEEYNKIIEEDLKDSELLTTHFFAKRSLINKFLQAIVRLFSPLL